MESRTFENAVFFTSFVPKVRADNNIVCTEAIGYNYLYVVNVCDGRVNEPVPGRDGHPVVARGLARSDSNQLGIAPEVALRFPSPDERRDRRERRVRRRSASSASRVAAGFTAFEPKRTYWRQRGAE